MKTNEWVIYEAPERLWTVLRHPSGAEAFFSSFQIGALLMQTGLPRLPQDPFLALAWMIDNGLRPSKIEGDTSVFAIKSTPSLGYEA